MSFFLNQNSTFFDVGANKGLYTKCAEDIVLPNRIYAFEPVPELSFFMRMMFRKSNIYKIALSDSEGKYRFKIPFIHHIENKFRGKLNTDYFEEGETRSRTIMVDVTTIDSFIRKNKITAIDFIKIDVEGHELKVIRGGLSTLRTLKPLMQVEIEQRHHYTPISEIITEIESIGYHCHYLDLTTRSLRPLDKDTSHIQSESDFKTNRYIHNFIFIPSDPVWKEKTSAINQHLANLMKFPVMLHFIELLTQ